MQTKFFFCQIIQNYDTIKKYFTKKAENQEIWLKQVGKASCVLPVQITFLLKSKMVFDKSTNKKVL